jgi:hypothetical protein
MWQRHRLFLAAVLILLLCTTAWGGAPLHTYGLGRPDSAVVERLSQADVLHRLQAHPLLQRKPTYFSIEKLRAGSDHTADFYLLLVLCLLLGTIRVVHPRYFQGLWRAFLNPALTNRQLKDQIQHDAIPNFLMNLFFSVAAGTYLYCVFRLIAPHQSLRLAPGLMVLVMIGGVALIYAVKFVAIRFSGWAFHVEAVTDQYLFNVFLINKVLAVALLPFILFLAFADPAWVSPLIVISLMLIGGLWVNRYLRSWRVFGSFFQYSRFHFFTYLCASEILPLAVLTKFLASYLLM